MLLHVIFPVDAGVSNSDPHACSVSTFTQRTFSIALEQSSWAFTTIVLSVVSVGIYTQWDVNDW